MGYTTSYTLHAKANRPLTDDDVARIDESLDELEVLDYALTEGWLDKYNNMIEWGACDMVKWYQHEEDMLKISKWFPEFTFCLFGDGESGDDHWAHYFHNGEEELCVAEIVYPSPKKIKWEN